jgi:hypothetical protein
MNITKNIIDRIEAYRLENKNPCKSYATEAKAIAVAEKKAAYYADYFADQGVKTKPARYIVAYNDAWGRWIVAFDFSELMSRNTSNGGFIGIAAQQGFYSY